MTRRRLQAFAAACLFALAITPADAARQTKELHYHDQHSFGSAVYLPQVQDRKYPGPGKYKQAVKGKKAVRHASRRAAPKVARTAAVSGPSTHYVERARSYIGMNARQIGLRRYTLWCSTFLNFITGGGTGSDLARSWADQKPRVSPQVGAVAVMSRGRRGGHVGIVSGFDRNGNPIVISGNHGNRVRETPYPRGRIYAYVMP